MRYPITYQNPELSQQTLFNILSSAVSYNYANNPWSQDNTKGNRLKSITKDGEDSFGATVIRAQNDIPFGLKVTKPSPFLLLFGAKAKITIEGDSMNILSMGTDFSNSMHYTLWSSDPEKVDKLAEKMASNLNTQFAVRCALGI